MATDIAELDNEALDLASAELTAALAHVPVDVTVRLAQKQVPLAEVLALRRGDVLVFEQGVGEPVELIAAGRTVARGELVLVEEQMGLRIIEVSPATGEGEA
jgi:flagellar motor switch protein FliN